MIESRCWSRFDDFASYCRRQATEHGIEALVPAVGVAEGHCSLDAGSADVALERFETARDAADRLGDPWWMGLADLGIAEASRRLGLREEVARHRSKAIEVFTKLGSVRELDTAMAVTTS